MILRQTISLLITCVFISPVLAMNDVINDGQGDRKVISQSHPVKDTQNLDDWEVINSSDLKPVTVRMWKNPDTNENSGHISVETPQHYMSLHPVSEKIENRGYLCYESPCFASPSFKID